MQIQYNITRIEEWCKSHEMPEGLLQLEHLMQATKLLQLKKVSHLRTHLRHIGVKDLYCRQRDYSSGIHSAWAVIYKPI